jgi:hypothetical protein
MLKRKKHRHDDDAFQNVWALSGLNRAPADYESDALTK